MKELKLKGKTGKKMQSWSPVPKKLLLVEICYSSSQASVQSSQNANQNGLSETSVLCYQILHICDPRLPCESCSACSHSPLTAVSANPLVQYEEAKTIYTFVSSPSKRPIRSMFLSIVARHVISLAHSMGNQPLSPSRRRSPSYQPAGVNRQGAINLFK